MDYEKQQISYGQELLRKLTHLIGLIVPGLYYYLDLTKFEALVLLIPPTLMVIMIDLGRLKNWKIWHSYASKYLSSLVRGHEAAGDFTGASYILVTYCFVVALFDKPIAIAAILFIIVGDACAALIGRKFGKHKFGRKSIEGSLGCLAGTLIVAWVVPDVAFVVAAPGAVVATISEALLWRVDDNVTVPLFSGGAMMILQAVL